jgi:hypothetical protein
MSSHQSGPNTNEKLGVVSEQAASLGERVDDAIACVVTAASMSQRRQSNQSSYN